MIVSMYDIDPLKSFVDLVYDSTDTIKLVFNNEGLRINLLNNSHVCFYNVEFKREYFEVYDINDLEELIFDSKDLYMVLKSASKNDYLTIKSDEQDVIFLFESDDKRRQFSIGLIDELYDSPTPPAIDYDVDFIMDWSDLKQCCTDLDKIVGTDRFKFSLNNEGLFVSNTIGTMKDYKNQLNTVSYNEYSTIVNLDYMSILSKLSKHGELHIRIGNNIPVSWSIDGYDVSYNGMIAPIMEED